MVLPDPCATAFSAASVRRTRWLSRDCFSSASRFSWTSDAVSSIYKISIGFSSAWMKSLTPTMIFSLRSTACWNWYEDSATSFCG